uniref:Phorbol-ester/DAG-type domain-containing protein n=1 Tax=Oryza punctata TaxID=4537 RepID=A0A0E0L8X4_ORYPU
MDKEDFTDSTCRISACDTCHFLVAGTVGYSCSSCRYKVHRVCPVPAATVNVLQPPPPATAPAATAAARPRPLPPGFGTQLGMTAANGFAYGVGSGVAREGIHYGAHYAAGSISSSHHQLQYHHDDVPGDDGQGDAFGFDMDY